MGQVITQSFVDWFKKKPSLQMSHFELSIQLSQFYGQEQWSGSGVAKQLE